MNKLSTLAFSLLILSGCVYKRMIFNNLDWLVVYQMDSYLDLTGDQEKQIKIPVQETVTWLKAERLPAILDLLRDVLTAVEARKIEAKSYDEWVQRGNVWRTEVTDRMAPPLAHLLKQMSDEQLETLEKKTRKGDKELVKLLERSDREFPDAFEDYVDDAADNYKYWMGKLRKDQKQLLVQKLGWNRSYLEETLKQRRHSREFWFGILKKRDLPVLVTTLKASSQLDGTWDDAEYKNFRNQTRERTRDFILALLASLDQDQWQHLEKTLRELINDFQSLAVAERK